MGDFLALHIDRRLAVAVAMHMPAAIRHVIGAADARVDRGAAAREPATTHAFALATAHAHAGARTFATALAAFAALIAGGAHVIAAAAGAAFAATLAGGRAFTAALRRTAGARATA